MGVEENCRAAVSALASRWLTTDQRSAGIASSRLLDVDAIYMARSHGRKKTQRMSSCLWASRGCGGSMHKVNLDVLFLSSGSGLKAIIGPSHLQHLGQQIPGVNKLKRRAFCCWDMRLRRAKHAQVLWLRGWLIWAWRKSKLGCLRARFRGLLVNLSMLAVGFKLGLS